MKKVSVLKTYECEEATVDFVKRKRFDFRLLDTYSENYVLMAVLEDVLDGKNYCISFNDYQIAVGLK